MYSPQSFTRGALWALPVWAALLFYSALSRQPDPQAAFADFAAYVTTREFMLSHLVASIAGAAIGSVGVVALMLYLLDSQATGNAIVGATVTVVGNSLLSAVFGVAAFAQPAMGHAYLAGEINAVDFYNDVYAAPLIGTAVVGLLTFTLGGVLTGIAIGTCGKLPRWPGGIYAFAIVVFVLGNFLTEVGQSLAAMLLFIATAAVAWCAREEGYSNSHSGGLVVGLKQTYGMDHNI